MKPESVASRVISSTEAPTSQTAEPVQMSIPTPQSTSLKLRPLPALIFASRWLQLPLYLGLILAQGVYVFHFWVELLHLIEAVFGSEKAVFVGRGPTGFWLLFRPFCWPIRGLCPLSCAGQRLRSSSPTQRPS